MLIKEMEPQQIQECHSTDANDFNQVPRDANDATPNVQVAMYLDRVVREAVDRYRRNIDVFLSKKDDDEFFSLHEKAKGKAMNYFQSRTGYMNEERPAALSLRDKIREVFNNTIDSNWAKCEELCRKSLDEAKTASFSKSLNESGNDCQNYWKRMNLLHQIYTESIGRSLSSKMPFVWLEFLEERQEDDYKILLKEILKFDEVTERTEKGLQLRITWSRILLYWNYWKDCRNETIKLMRGIRKIYTTFEKRMNSSMENFLETFLSHLEHICPKLPMQFCHVINKDFKCFEILVQKVNDFIRMIELAGRAKTFGLDAERLFLYITSCHTNITETKQPGESWGLNIVESTLKLEIEEKGITFELHSLIPRTLFHLNDFIRRVAVEGSNGVRRCIEEMKEEQTYMETMFEDRELLLLKLQPEVEIAVDSLEKNLDKWLLKRKETIAELRTIIEKLDTTRRIVAVATTACSAAGVVGSLAALASGPGALGTRLIVSKVGSAVAKAGALAGVAAKVSEFIIDMNEMAKAKKYLLEDEILSKKLTESIKDVKRKSLLLYSYMPADACELLIPAKSNPLWQSGSLSYESVSPQSPTKEGLTEYIKIGQNVLRLAKKFSPAITKNAALSLGVGGAGIVFHTISLVLQCIELHNGVMSENAEKLEKQLVTLEEEKNTFSNILDDIE